MTFRAETPGDLAPLTDREITVAECNRIAYDRGVDVFTRALAFRLARGLSDCSRLEADNARLEADNARLEADNARLEADAPPPAGPEGVAVDEFDTTGCYAFTPYRPPCRVWADFQAFWARAHPGAPLPAAHNLPALTGLSRWQLRRVGAISAKRTKSRRKPPPND